MPTLCKGTKIDKKLHSLCAHCKFWVASPYSIQKYVNESDTPGLLNGGCHRYPPLSTAWPVTGGWSWCGEYKEKEDRSQIPFIL